MAAVFVACLFGIYSRPIGFLASVWPANAIMLGILLRYPASATPLGWLCGAMAYLAADLLTGASLLKAVLLNSANLVGIAAACAVYARLPSESIRLREPASMLHLVVAAAAAAGAAALVGSMANPILFGGSILRGWTFWFATEFVNYITILPVILAAPSLARASAGLRDGEKLTLQAIIPAGALLVSFLAAAIVGGPGAIAFPVPALLWCGLVYAVFPTSILTLLFGLWTLIVIEAGHMPVFGDRYDEMVLASVRLGASLVAIVPIVLSGVMQSRNALLAKLQHVASHDPLTGVSNRGDFLERARAMLVESRSFALLMMDLDHFKAVNDTSGHAAGDQVLAAFARRARHCLRPSDLLGRMGGEEFAILIRDCTPQDAAQIAERIRDSLAREPVGIGGGRTIAVTVSMGMVARAVTELCDVDALLADADAALYRAKANGRNRLELS